MIFRNLSPLIKSPTEIHYATYQDIKPLVPINPYAQTEEQDIKEFDSREQLPQLIFLGLDESDKNGYQFKNYTGAPYFALDVTPKEPFEQAARDVAEGFEKAGLGFVEGMRAMSFPADVGK